MPVRAPYICGCGHQVQSGALCACALRRARQRKATHDARRPSARQRGYDSKWEAARRVFLAQPENRFCVCGCGKRADTVDHIKPHRGNQELFWDTSNWQAMAFQCHSSKKQAAERAQQLRGEIS